MMRFSEKVREVGCNGIDHMDTFFGAVWTFKNFPILRETANAQGPQPTP